MGESLHGIGTLEDKNVQELSVSRKFLKFQERCAYLHTLHVARSWLCFNGQGKDSLRTVYDTSTSEHWKTSQDHSQGYQTGGLLVPGTGKPALPLSEGSAHTCNLHGSRSQQCWVWAENVDDDTEPFSWRKLSAKMSSCSSEKFLVSLLGIVKMPPPLWSCPWPLPKSLPCLLLVRPHCFLSPPLHFLCTHPLYSLPWTLKYSLEISRSKTYSPPVPLSSFSFGIIYLCIC